jgi:hypothetical protein
VTLLAPHWARAVYDLFTHTTAWARQKFVHGSGRGVGELDAERDDQGLPLTRDALPSTHDQRTPASRHADARSGPSPSALRLLRHLRVRLRIQREVSTVHGGCSSPEPAPPWRTLHVYPVVGRGRDEGPEMLLGRRARTSSSRQASFPRR